VSEHTLSTLLEGGAFFEGPRWQGDRWWVSDFYRGVVSTVTPDGHEEQVLAVEGQPSGIGWMPDGSMLVVSMRDHRVLRVSEDGAVATHADLTDLCHGHLNDMVVDSTGRAWVGSFGFDLMGGEDPAPARLVRVDPDGRAEVAAEHLLFPNGSVVTPDGLTLIVGETLGCRYTAFTIDEDGTLSDRRPWARLAPTPELGTLEETLPQVTVGPDGCALDVEGHIWSADAIGGRCIRIAPGGDVVDDLRAPEGLGIFACMLGGDDGRTLLLCAAPDFQEHKRRDAREGVLLTARVDAPHAGLP